MNSDASETPACCRAQRALLAGVLYFLSFSAFADLTEEDFFHETPVLLTTTRLAQSLRETPGAVTVLDRDIIRASGARTLADLLRLVPGYIVSGFNGANPVAAYHAPVDEFGTRNLVLVDGRSVYSNTVLGGTIRGMVAVALEDVERVEVLRGSNSAAYGANAMFGVINVITRHADDTLGQSLSLQGGNEGVAGTHARIGWRSDTASHRLSLHVRQDNGYRLLNDDARLAGVHWRSDITVDPSTALLLTAGLNRMVYGEGFVARPTNPERDVSWRTAHVAVRWTRQLSPTEQLSWSLGWDGESQSDRFFVPPFSAFVDFGTRDTRWQAEIQHQFEPAQNMRLVWGGGFKEDSAVSSALYFTRDRVRQWDVNGFANLEWRFTPNTLLNAGWFGGRNSVVGIYGNPRLMFNHQLDPNHTLRWGWSTSQRNPTLFERFADIRFFNTSGVFLGQRGVPNPNIQAERLSSREISYLGRFPTLNLGVDARLYEERNRNGIRRSAALQYVNETRFETSGLEWQLTWSPRAGTELLFNHNVNRFAWSGSNTPLQTRPPRHFSTLGWRQRLPEDWDLALWVYSRDDMGWRSRLEADVRADLRIARQFRLKGARAESALTIQSLNGERAEFVNGQNVPRRVFLTLNVEH